jgi:hypothetical protein
VHIGIGCGNVAGFHVGGLRNRWEFFIMGDACNQMYAAEGEAAVGECVMSRACLNIIESHRMELDILDFVVERLPTGFAKVKVFEWDNANDRFNAGSSGHHEEISSSPTSSSSSLALMSRDSDDLTSFLHSSLPCYIPYPIMVAINEGLKTGADGVLRELCVLFIKLPSLINEIGDTKDAVEAQADRIQSVVSKVQESAYHGNATLRQFIIDDKGAVAIVVVGLPPVTYKNSSRGIKIGMRILEHK